MRVIFCEYSFRLISHNNFLRNPVKITAHRQWKVHKCLQLTTNPISEASNLHGKIPNQIKVVIYELMCALPLEHDFLQNF